MIENNTLPSKVYFSKKLTFWRYDYSEINNAIEQLAHDRLAVKPPGTYKFENVRLGFVGEVIFAQYLRQNDYQFEYDIENYATHGDCGWDFKVNSLTIDCKCRSAQFETQPEYFKFLNASKIWTGSGKLKADRYILMFDHPDRYCDIVGWISNPDLSRYRESSGIHSPYISRFNDISSLFS